MNWKLSSLISAGTGICGASAIGAIAPVIDAEAEDISYYISATFLFDILMVILFPIIGKTLNMSDLGFGLWTGTAVNDTSSVLATGYSYSDIAGQYSIIVKLTRTFSIIPTVIIFSYINHRKKYRSNDKNKYEKLKIIDIFPWFIILFLLMVVIRSLGLIGNDLSYEISKISKFMMTMSLASIGLNTDFKKMFISGLNPMLHGFIISLLVVLVSLAAQAILGQL